MITRGWCRFSWQLLVTKRRWDGHVCYIHIERDPCLGICNKGTSNLNTSSYRQAYLELRLPNGLVPEYYDKICLYFLLTCLVHNQPSGLNSQPPSSAGTYKASAYQSGPNNFLVLYSPRRRWSNQMPHYGGYPLGITLAKYFADNSMQIYVVCRVNISSPWHAPSSCRFCQLMKPL